MDPILNVYNLFFLPQIPNTPALFTVFDPFKNPTNSNLFNQYLEVGNISLLKATTHPFYLKPIKNNLYSFYLINQPDNFYTPRDIGFNRFFTPYSNYFSNFIKTTNTDLCNQTTFVPNNYQPTENSIGFEKNTTDIRKPRKITLKYYLDRLDIYGPIFIFILVLTILLVLVIRLPTPPSNVLNAKHTNQENSRRWTQKLILKKGQFNVYWIKFKAFLKKIFKSK